MKKNWKIEGSPAKYDTYDAALDRAKRCAVSGCEGYGIYELVAIAKSKTPDVDVILVTA